MDNKKYIKLRLSTVLLISISIILLIFLICLGFYIHFSNNNYTGSLQYNDNSNNIGENTSKNIVSSENLTTNSNSNNTTVNTASGEELDINSTLVKSLVEKIDFDSYAMASILKLGNFNISNIPNDLILRLGWDKLTPTDKQQINSTLKVTVTSDILKKSITNIFGNSVNYTDGSFQPVDVPTFYEYLSHPDQMGIVEYSQNDNLYTENMYQGGGRDLPFIHTELQKAIKYDDKIDIYVNPVFIDIEYSDYYDNYILYKSFNFDTNTFEESISIVSSDDYSKAVISSMSNRVVSNISNKLNTYVFTFNLDSTTGNYYLYGFNSAN